MWDVLRFPRLGSSPEAAADRQSAHLRRTVARAWRDVPYYRRLFERAGIAPRDIVSLDDLPKIPLSSKRDMRSCPPEDLLSRRAAPRRLLTFKTSGSTGIPMTIRESPFESWRFNLVKFRALRSLGLRWGDRMIKIQGGGGDIHRPASWRALQGLGLLRQESVHSSSPGEVASVLAGKTADVLSGYTGFLARVARILSDRPDSRLRPRFVVAGSETMTPLLRDQIRSGFRAALYDTYICREAGMIAWQCPRSGLYHVEDGHVIVEVLKDGRPARPGEQGEVVVSSLVRRAMPFIRYRLDDLAVIAGGKCPCGRRTALFDRVLGKTQDSFWLPGGVEFNPWRISGLWTSRAAWVLQFELVQEAEAAVVMRIVPAAPPPPFEVAALTDESRKLLGPRVDFRVEFVEDIPPGAGGKFHFHRSLVKPSRDQP